MERRHAIVIGGGIGGMCAARALSDSFERVTVLERDAYPKGSESRPGVPQGKMFHTLLERGRREIEGLFPGFHRLLNERKAPRLGFGFNVALMSSLGWSRGFPFPIQQSIVCSRALLESTMRDLFFELSNVEVREGSTVDGLMAAPRNGRMTCSGVRLRGSEEVLEADLVVDASGAGSRATKWLADLGLSAPDEETLDPLLTYAGQLFRLRPGARMPAKWWWTHGVMIQRVPPKDSRGAHFLRQEGDLWLLTLVAGSGEKIPRDSEGVAEFVASMRSPLIADMLPYFEPVSKINGYRLPKNKRVRYDTWQEDFPGFLALGASTCVFNPNQGQGMSVAATSGAILRSCVAETTSAAELPKRFHREQARFQWNPWRLAISNDLKFDSVVGHRSLGTRFFNWYRDQLVGSGDLYLQRRAAEVDFLLEPVSALFRPVAIARTLLARTLLRWRVESKAVRFGPVPPETPPYEPPFKVRMRDWLALQWRRTALVLGVAR